MRPGGGIQPHPACEHNQSLEMNPETEQLIKLHEQRAKAAKLIAEAYDKAKALLIDDPDESGTLQEIWDALTA